MTLHLTNSDLVDVIEGQPAEAVRDHILECDRCAREVSGLQFATTFPTAMPEVLRRELGRIESEAAETRAAAGLLEPARFSAGAVLADPRAHSVTFVRSMLDVATAQRETAPAFALELTDVAVQIAEGLTDDEPGSPVLPLLRATASRERANALRYLGRYDDALVALDRAGKTIAGVLVAGHEEARIHFGRATVLVKMHRFEEAEVHARASFELFSEFGDAVRVCDAQLLFALIAFERREYAVARERFTVVLKLATALDDASRIALAENNLGAAEQECGDLVAAAEHFRSAVALYEHLGMTIERARTEWSLGLLSLSIGQHADAVRRLRSAAEALSRSGSAADAALVAIDLAEFYVQQGDRTAADRVLAEIARENLPLHAVTAVDVLRRQLGDAPGSLFVETRLQLRLPE